MSANRDNFDRCKKILSCIKRPKSVHEITLDTKIPIASVYRNLHKLENHGMLVTSGLIKKHRKYRLFKSKYSSEMLETKLKEMFSGVV